MRCVTLAGGAVLALCVAVLAVRGAGAEAPAGFSYDVPLDPGSPWPKFRRNALQNGRSPIVPVDSGRAPWAFHTGKGVFSTPVIDADGTIYVGSADRHFYAIDRDGNLKWKFLTGEIIDSSALLDDQERVIFGSGDGRLYALDRRTGTPLWVFAADPPATNSAFINWFEGNVAIGTDGTLYVPNDNFCTYGVRRDSGELMWCSKSRDQTWSLPAVNPRSGRLFVGNNFAFFGNMAALDAGTGRRIWSGAADGSVAASPMLTSSNPDAAVIVGGFDGFLRAYDQRSGRERWRFGARDHLYGSPAQLSDGTVIQPSADGTIYAVDPESGSVRWAFDALEPIRSSPAVDGRDLIYIGSGEGRLFVLNPDGTLRWSMRLIDEERDDLNGSPALGNQSIVIAGENGGVFSVPYEYCLRPGTAQDQRCRAGGGEALPADGVFLLYTTPFGRLLPRPPSAIEAHQPLTFSLLVRRGGDTVLAVLDSESVRVRFDPEIPVHVDLSGDRKFITIVPKDLYAGPSGGTLRVRIEGRYLVDLQRSGLRFHGGHPGGSFDESFEFDVQPRAGGAFPLPVPHAPGDPSGVWELYRLAAPLPAILPSYNQIGFDSIHYLIGMVEGDGRSAIAWAVGGRLAEGGNRTEIDPASRVRFPLELEYDRGLLVFRNQAGFTIEFNGFPLPFQFFHIAARLGARGDVSGSAALNARTVCGEIDFYGEFLQRLGYCNPTTDLLTVAGGAELRPHREAVQSPPSGVGEVSFRADFDGVTAELTGSELRPGRHNLGLLLIDARTGQPLPLGYSTATGHTVTSAGTLASVRVAFAPGEVRGAVRAYLMVDTYPAAVGALDVPETVPWRVRARYAVARILHSTRQASASAARRLVLRLLRWIG